MDTTKPYVKAGLIGGAIGAVLTVVSAIPFLNCLLLPITCLSFFLLPMGVGYYTAKLGGSNDYSKVAGEGAFAGSITAIITGVVNIVVSLMLSMFGLAVGTGLSTFGSDYSDLAYMGASSGVGIWSTLIFGICGLIFGLIINAAFGALGGVIKVAIDSNSASPDTVNPENNNSQGE